MRCLGNERIPKRRRVTVFFQFLIIFFNFNLISEELDKTTISVYGLKSIDISQSLAESLQEHLESNLLNYQQYDVLSRNDIELILKESRFQQTGICQEEDCLVEAGNLLGVEKIITGTISLVGTTYNVVLKLIDVTTAKLESSVNNKHSGSIDTLLDVIEISLHKLLGEKQHVSEERPSQEHIEKLKKEFAALKERTTQLHEDWEIEKNRNLQLELNQRILKEEKEQLQERIDTENSVEKVVAQSEYIADAVSKTVDNPDSYVTVNTTDDYNINIQAKKQGRKIGIGAVLLLAVIGVGVLLGQMANSH